MVALPERASGDAYVRIRPDAQPAGELSQEVRFDLLGSSTAVSGLSYREVVDSIPSAVIVTDPDGFIVMWNATAELLYGWSESEVLGRAIVELLVPNSDDDLAASHRKPIATGYEADRLLISKGGALLDVHVTTQPIRRATGELAAIVGVSSDIRELKAAKSALEDASENLRLALAGETRRALLAEATGDLAISLSVTDSLQRLARLVVPELADWVIIDLADEHAKPHQVAMLHRDGHHEAIERFTVLQPTAMTEQAPIMQVLATGRPILRPETSIDELLEICGRLGICSVMYVPMVARGRTLGCLTLVSGVSGRHYEEADLHFAMGLAQRAALVVDNSSLYEREHHIAKVLQESLLPTVPLIPGLDIAARYRPSDIYTQVGGDFYDVLSLPDGSVALIVGDVMGHDLVAAATMGQLRGHLRACAWEAAVDGANDPGAVLDRTDRLVQGLTLTETATVWYGKVEQHPGSDEMWTLTYATAGHPMPLLRSPEGRTTGLEGTGMLIGGPAQTGRVSRAATIPEGSVLVAFSDGLVERRSRPWDDALEAVRRALDAAPQDIATTDLADLLLDVVDEERSDDTVVLVVRFV
jgi:PAS domain S-box-containing protein